VYGGSNEKKQTELSQCRDAVPIDRVSEVTDRIGGTGIPENL